MRETFTIIYITGVAMSMFWLTNLKQPLTRTIVYSVTWPFIAMFEIVSGLIHFGWDNQL